LTQKLLSQRPKSPLAYEGKTGNIPIIATVEMDGGVVLVVERDVGSNRNPNFSYGATN
jgi:hypothetical protein